MFSWCLKYTEASEKWNGVRERSVSHLEMEMPPSGCGLLICHLYVGRISHWQNYSLTFLPVTSCGLPSHLKSEQHWGQKHGSPGGSVDQPTIG